MDAYFWDTLYVYIKIFAMPLLILVQNLGPVLLLKSNSQKAKGSYSTLQNSTQTKSQKCNAAIQHSCAESVIYEMTSMMVLGLKLKLWHMSVQNRR